MNGYITGKNRECRSSSLVSVVATDLSNYFKGLDAAEFVVQITYFIPLHVLLQHFLCA